jgi:hypothetical protein
MKILLLATLLTGCAHSQPWRDAVNTCIRIVGAKTTHVGDSTVGTWCSRRVNIEVFSRLNEATDEMVGDMIKWEDQ